VGVVCGGGLVGCVGGVGGGGGAGGRVGGVCGWGVWAGCVGGVCWWGALLEFAFAEGDHHRSPGPARSGDPGIPRPPEIPHAEGVLHRRDRRMLAPCPSR